MSLMNFHALFPPKAKSESENVEKILNEFGEPRLCSFPSTPISARQAYNQPSYVGFQKSTKYFTVDITINKTILFLYISEQDNVRALGIQILHNDNNVTSINCVVVHRKRSFPLYWSVQWRFATTTTRLLLFQPLVCSERGSVRLRILLGHKPDLD